ncbi:hypothetical protein Pcinc_013604 [Petrolisthes cinctipes]|uniref:Uncharacterized protein n=1 Tax=Petrolisthes cinctipes TaxID=88211 RepID=A0AAE1FX53_PETCI|nr:hypothetical protein Pcinc_013604 [Petrolisthes cinctipes]
MRGSGEIRRLLLTEDYDKTHLPRPPGGGPLVVGLSFNIKGVYEVNLHQMTIVVAMYFRMSWSEPRVQEVETIVPLDSELVRKAWLPDLYFHEAREVTTFMMIQNVEGVYLTPPKTFLFSLMYDKYGDKELEMEWLQPLGVSADPGVARQLPGYDFTLQYNNISTKLWCSNCTFEPASMGEARLVLARQYTLHLLTIYVPSSLFVAVSWASFFWPPDVIPGRTVLIITSLLTVVSMYAAIGQKSPETSYLKAVDVWMFMCIVLVVLTLFQYAIIITLRRRRSPGPASTTVVPQNSPDQSRKGMGTPLGQLTITRSSPESIASTASVSNHVKGQEQQEQSSVPSVPWETKMEMKVERAGQFGIPLVYLLFNIVYWSCYLA